MPNHLLAANRWADLLARGHCPICRETFARAAVAERWQPGQLGVGYESYGEAERSCALRWVALACLGCPWLWLDRFCDVCEASPESAVVEVVEAEVAVEAGGPGGEGVHDDGAGAEFVATSYAATERVDEQVPAE